MQGSFQFDMTAAGIRESGPSESPSIKFEYDALTPAGKRKAAPARVIREDSELLGGKRIKLQANARDIAKNFSIAGWACRRHLDYVSSFSFNPTTTDRGLNKELQALMEVQSRPLNCDRGGRCSREKMFRLLEMSRVLDGDIGMVRLRDGRTQLIESDLIKNPEKEDQQDREKWEWVDGVQIDYAGFLGNLQCMDAIEVGRGLNSSGPFQPQIFICMDSSIARRPTRYVVSVRLSRP